MSDRIDKFSKASDKKISKQTSDENSAAVRNTGSLDRANTGRGVSKVSRRFGALARFFKREKPRSSVLQPHLSEKLKKSIREHINTALRFARQGDVSSAKIHANLANNALKEIAHYMSEEEYASFEAEVEKRLEEIQ